MTRHLAPSLFLIDRRSQILFARTSEKIPHLFHEELGGIGQLFQQKYLLARIGVWLFDHANPL